MENKNEPENNEAARLNGPDEITSKVENESHINITSWRLFKEKEGIYWLKIDRESKRNAFNEQVVRELDVMLDFVEKQADARVLVITSISDAFFSAGADIEMFLGISKENAYEEGRAISVGVQRVFGKIEDLPIPVIAAIKGLNLTAGLEMSMCCDMIIAADNAQFGQIETRYGITPGGGGTQRLTRLVGPLNARDLIYTARIIDAQEAYRMGLVNKVVPLKYLEQEVRKICKSIIKNSKRAIAESKRLIKMAIYSNEKGFLGENDVFGKDFDSGEPRQRLMEFIKKSKTQ